MKVVKVATYDEVYAMVLGLHETIATCEVDAQSACVMAREALALAREGFTRRGLIDSDKEKCFRMIEVVLTEIEERAMARRTAQ